MPVLLALVSAFLFSLSVPFSKILLKDIPPLFLASLLYIGGGTGIAIVKFFSKGEKESSMEKKDMPWIIGFILFGSVLAPVFLLKGLSMFSASLSSLLMNFEILFTAAAAVWFFGENSSIKLWTALSLMLLSAFVATWPPAGDFASADRGALYILAGAMFWGLDNNFTAKVSLKNPLTLSMIKCFAGGAVNLTICMFFCKGFAADISALPSALLLGFVSYGLSLSLLIYAMRSLGAVRSQFFFSLNPFMAALLSLIILGEEANTRFFAAFSLALLAVLTILSEKHAHRHKHPYTAHSHRHTHDAHHEHGHTGEHAHFHIHDETEHSHIHYPDPHHRHGH